MLTVSMMLAALVVAEPPPKPPTPLPPVHRVATNQAETALETPSWIAASTAVRRGLSYLAATQSRRGGWLEETEVTPTDQPPQRPLAAAVAVTALGLKAFAQAPTLAPNELPRDKALSFVRAALDEDGFASMSASGLGNYVTSSIVMGLAAAGTDTAVLQQGVAWLTNAQWDSNEEIQPTSDWFGGAGYGKRGRPDLSNTQFMLDALYDAGVSPDEPAVQRALVFLSRTQNLKATNPAPWAQAGTNDGGFIYTPANHGESMASEAVGEGRYGELMPVGTPRSLRSYGSMTYAGFKSLLYAGLGQDDPRVAAALKWIQAHYSFGENPGLGQQGYFYYLHAMARALRAAGIDSIIDADGVEHDWRTDLIAALAARQRPGGDWINAVDRWEEGHADLTTIYAVLALQEALKPTSTIE